MLECTKCTFKYIRVYKVYVTVYKVYARVYEMYARVYEMYAREYIILSSLCHHCYDLSLYTRAYTCTLTYLNLDI